MDAQAAKQPARSPKKWRFRVPKPKLSAGTPAASPPADSQLDYFTPPPTWYPLPKWLRAITTCPGRACNHNAPAKPGYEHLPPHLLHRRGRRIVCFESVIWTANRRWRQFCELEDMSRDDFPTGFTPWHCARSDGDREPDETIVCEVLWHLSPTPARIADIARDLKIGLITLGGHLRSIRQLGIPIAIDQDHHPIRAWIPRQHWPAAERTAARLFDHFHPHY